MDEFADDADHLSQIQTQWSVVREAHGDNVHEVQAAMQTLLERYGGAVKRYLLAAFRDQDAADEVFQEFALKFIRGDLHAATPERGRFRNYVKTIVYRLIVDHQRRRKRCREAQVDYLDPMDPGGVEIDEHDFVRSWRDDLLSRTWTQLERFEAKTQRPYFTLMRLRADFPEARSDELAERLSERIGGIHTAGAIRVALHRARDYFADLLLTEVSHSLGQADAESVEAELIDLDLMKYTREAFAERFKK